MCNQNSSFKEPNNQCCNHSNAPVVCLIDSSNASLSIVGPRATLMMFVPTRQKWESNRSHVSVAVVLATQQTRITTEYN
jgi:hypothetical protein